MLHFDAEALASFGNGVRELDGVTVAEHRPANRAVEVFTGIHRPAVVLSPRVAFQSLRTVLGHVQQISLFGCRLDASEAVREVSRCTHAEEQCRYSRGYDKNLRGRRSVELSNRLLDESPGHVRQQQ